MNPALDPEFFKKSTTIRISRRTKQNLVQFARYGESMDHIISKIIEKYITYYDRIKKIEEKYPNLDV